MIEIDVDEPPRWLAKEYANVLAAPIESAAKIGFVQPKLLPTCETWIFTAVRNWNDRPAAAKIAKGSLQRSHVRSIASCHAPGSSDMAMIRLPGVRASCCHWRF
jgi:hypothetical protein